MNGSKGYRASDAGEKDDRGEITFSLQTVHRMLPLVQRIVDDLLAHQNALNRLYPEEEALGRRKRNLDWPQRRRRYQLREEMERAEQSLQGAREELEELGVVV